MPVGRNLQHIVRSGAALFLTIFMLLFSATVAAQQSQEEAPLHRQFGFSRTKAGETKAKSEEAVTSAKPAREAKKKPSKVGSNSKVGQKPQLPSDDSSNDPASAAPLTLGYSIIQGSRAVEGERILVTRASKVFRIGDRIRLLIETNMDGHLYVFNTVDGKDAEMIFPNPRLNGGENRIEAHVPYEIPSRENPNPKLQWFEFQPPPGAEQLYLVFSRRPLEGIPVGAALVSRCRGQIDCLVRPEIVVWERIAAAEKHPKVFEALKSDAPPLAEAVNKSIARRIRLAPEAPQPIVLSQNKSPNNDQIVVVVNLESMK